MRVDNKTGAPKNKSKDMRKHEGIVKRLQQRIAKAIEDLLYCWLSVELDSFSKLEPYAGKLARAVLRGDGTSNGLRLPDPVYSVLRG